MHDKDNTKEELLAELAELRRHLSEHAVTLAEAEECKESQQLINNSLPVLIATAGLDGYYKEVNAAFERILGWTEPESLSRPFIDFIHPDDRKAARGAFARLKSGEPAIDFQDRNICKDDTYRWINWTVIPVPDRDIVYGIGQDFTERKRAEDDLKLANERLEQRVSERTAELTETNDRLRAEVQQRRKSEAKYRALVESCPDPVMMIDLQGSIVFASQRALEQHRVADADAFLGRSAAEFVAESDRENFKASIGRLLADGVHRNVEYTLLREDGSKFVAEVSSSVIWDAAGKPEARMAVYRDISERKRAQEAIQREQESLRRLLQASDRERELISYDIHDGVAQQLLGALLHIETVSNRNLSLTEETKGYLDAAVTALRRASAEARGLINRMRTPVLQRFGIRPAVADFIDQIMDRADAPEILYHCEADFGRLAAVLENAIFRVAQEAITNACVHSNTDWIRVSLTQQNDEVTVEVQDNGVGFDVACKKENRFGLDGIRERVRLLGKTLTIESASGQGTCIRATFPLVPCQEPKTGN